MVLYAVARTVQRSRPDLSLRSRAVVEAVLLSGGSIGTSQHVALHLGLRNRFELARLLKREGLPSLHDLAAWASVLTWLNRAEGTGCSLCNLAFHARKDPATCYRTVKRVTGLCWVELRKRGLQWMLKRFVAHCQGRTMAIPRGRGTLCQNGESSPRRQHAPERPLETSPALHRQRRDPAGRD